MVAHPGGASAYYTRAAAFALLVLSFLVPGARAQFTLVSGTVTDANGLPWACGTISATLINNNGVSPTLNGVGFSGFTAPVKLGCPTDPTTSRTAGAFQMQLADNTLIKCGISVCGTQTTWQFTANTTGIAPPQGTGPQSFSQAFTISGASQTLSFSGVPALSLSGGGSGVAANVVNPTNTKYAGGAKYDGHITFIPTLTNTSNIITAADANFTGTDLQGRPIAVVNQKIFCTNATTDLSMETSTIILVETTILSVDSATQIHTTANATATTAATGICIFGDIDTAPSGTTPSTLNDPTLASWTDAANNCLPYGMPAGMTLWDHFEIQTFPTTGGCGNQNSLTNIRRGFNIFGVGMNATIIVIMPNAPATDCTGPNAASTGCLLTVPNPVFSNFQVFGGGNSACGAGFNGKSLYMMLGIFPGFNFTLNNVLMSGFCANQSNAASGPIGFNLGNGVNTGVSGGQIDNFEIETFGATGCNIDPGVETGGSAMINAHNLWCNATQNNVNLKSGVLNSVNGLYGWAFGAFSQPTGVSIEINSGATFNSTNDVCEGDTSTGGGPCVWLASTATMNISNGVFISPTAGGAVFIFGSGTPYLGVRNSFISGSLPIFVTSASAGSKYQDLGGNSYTATTTFFTNAANFTYIPYRSVTGICTGTVGSAATDGFYGTGPNVTTTACAATLGNGVVMDHSGTARVLIATASAGGVNGSDGVVTVLKNGATQALTTTLGTGTVATDGTHTFNYVVGDRISCQIVTQAASTAANPTCMVDLGSQ